MLLDLLESEPDWRYTRDACATWVESDARKRVPPGKNNQRARRPLTLQVRADWRMAGSLTSAGSAFACSPRDPRLNDRRTAPQPLQRRGAAVEETADGVTETFPVDWLGEVLGETGGFGGGDVAIGSEPAKGDSIYLTGVT